MRERQKDFGCLPIFRFLGVALVASMTTACSSDLMRFSEAPFSNPFQGKVDTTATGSVRGIKASTLGVAPTTQSLSRSSNAQTVAAATQVAASGNQSVTGGVAGWTATGGTAVTAGAGDTIEALSGRYGVPASALRAVNGLGGGQPSPGQKIIIPAYKPGAPAAKVAANGAAYAPTPATQTTQAASSRAPRYEALTDAPKAKAAPRTPRYESLDSAPKTQVRKADPASAPKTAKAKAPKLAAEDDEDEAPAKRSSAKAAEKKAQTPAQKQAVKPAPKQAVKRTVENAVDQPLPPKAPTKPAKAAKVATAPEPKTAKAEPKADEPAKSETTASVEQEFRWPARGRVISGYGSKGPSGTNDGINIAVPEGTSVKAAEGGTVAYAGEEIKGYGKMVLIRHPNGYVSAYAHNGDLNVKRGDVVKRGQQIAKSGQTGNVTSPQLHFELRKGSEPVDPSKFLD